MGCLTARTPSTWRAGAASTQKRLSCADCDSHVLFCAAYDSRLPPNRNTPMVRREGPPVACAQTAFITHHHADVMIAVEVMAYCRWRWGRRWGRRGGLYRGCGYILRLALCFRFVVTSAVTEAVLTGTGTGQSLKKVVEYSLPYFVIAAGLHPESPPSAESILTYCRPAASSGEQGALLHKSVSLSLNPEVTGEGTVLLLCGRPLPCERACEGRPRK